MITNRTEAELAQVFADIANANPSVAFFSYGNREQIFSDNHDQVFPSIYIQIISSTVALQRITRIYRIYSLDKPVAPVSVDHQSFEFDTALPNARDTALVNLTDTLTSIRNFDLQGYTLDLVGELATSDREKEGEVAWAGNFSIGQDYII